MRFSLLATLPFFAMSLAACNGGGNNSGSKEKTINIKLYLGGYGSEWLNKLITQFETTYADEGYKVNLLRPSTSNLGGTIINELSSGYKKNQIDLYFTASIKPQQVVDGDYGLLVEDITESVYNQNPIKYDGTLESKTVAEKLDPSFEDEYYKYDGKAYNFLYQKSVGALAVNKKKLQSFGLELPLTTNDFINCIDTIREDGGKIKPMTFVGSGVNGYPTVMMNSWFSQYSGIEAWNNFWSMNNPDGTYNKETGYKVFEDEGLHKAAALVYQVFDFNNFVKGASGNDLSAAHTDMMANNKGAVFMFDGDWMLNECSIDYSEEQLNDLAFINVPVISDLGVKLWGETYSTDQCEQILKNVIKLTDSHKTVGEIKQDISALGFEISEESIQEVCEARGIFNNRGVETANCYMPTGLSETKKDIASKFLRMFASDDFAKTYLETAKCVSPYSSNVTETTYKFEFNKGHSDIVNHDNAKAIWPNAKGLRKNIAALGNMFPVSGTQLHAYAFKANVADGKYKEASEAELANEYSVVTASWSNWVKNL